MTSRPILGIPILQNPWVLRTDLQSFHNFRFLLMPVIDNVNRVQGNFVSQRRRWFINVVLVLAVIGL